MSTATAPWEEYAPSLSKLADLRKSIAPLNRKSIIQYMKNPLSHPDMISNSEESNISDSSSIQSSSPSQAKYSHIDGFKNPPLFQSHLVRVETNMANRIGGRGIIATQDIAPGTILFAEYLRFPFRHQGSKDEEGNSLRAEIEFIQEFVFDISYNDQNTLLDDLSSLFPFNITDIEDDHRQFLDYIYGDILKSILEVYNTSHDEVIAEAVTTPTTTTPPLPARNPNITYDTLIRLICVVHFNSFPSGILLHTSMVNHSCRPNSVKLFVDRKTINNTIKKNTSSTLDSIPLHDSIIRPTPVSDATYSELRATEYIKAGDEIYISYIPADMSDLTGIQRRNYLYRQFRFKCSCTLCVLEQQQQQEQQQQEKEEHTEERDKQKDEDDTSSEDTTVITTNITDPNIYLDQLSFDYLNIAGSIDQTTQTSTQGLEHSDITTKYNLPFSLSHASFVYTKTLILLSSYYIQDNDSNMFKHVDKQYDTLPILALSLPSISSSNTITIDTQIKSYHLIADSYHSMMKSLHNNTLSIESQSLLLILLINSTLFTNKLTRLSTYITLLRLDNTTTINNNNNIPIINQSKAIKAQNNAGDDDDDDDDDGDEHYTLQQLLSDYWKQLITLQPNIMSSLTSLSTISSSSSSLFDLINAMAPLTHALQQHHGQLLSTTFEVVLGTHALYAALSRLVAYRSTLALIGTPYIFLSEISPKYGQMLDTISRILMILISNGPHTSKLFKHPFFIRNIGPKPGDPTKMQATLNKCYVEICALFNNCPIESVVKGI